MTTPPIQDISTVEQLRAANRQLGIASIVGRVPHFRFAIAGLSDASNREATERMSTYESECGCFAGGLLMGASVLGCIVIFIVSGISNFMASHEIGHACWPATSSTRTSGKVRSAAGLWTQLIAHFSGAAQTSPCGALSGPSAY
jgi:hypothetical protein